MESMDNLRMLRNRHQDIKAKKMEAISEQRYEMAAFCREMERQIIHEIEGVFMIDEKQFEDPDTLVTVKKNLLEVIQFIHDDDTNLTPALIRKLTNDTKKAKEEVQSLKSKIEEVLRSHK
jgi:hypothetical protein